MFKRLILKGCPYSVTSPQATTAGNQSRQRIYPSECRQDSIMCAQPEAHGNVLLSNNLAACRGICLQPALQAPVCQCLAIHARLALYNPVDSLLTHQHHDRYTHTRWRQHLLTSKRPSTQVTLGVHQPAQQAIRAATQCCAAATGTPLVSTQRLTPAICRGQCGATARARRASRCA